MQVRTTPVSLSNEHMHRGRNEICFCECCWCVLALLRSSWSIRVYNKYIPKKENRRRIFRLLPKKERKHRMKISSLSCHCFSFLSRRRRPHRPVHRKWKEQHASRWRVRPTRRRATSHLSRRSPNRAVRPCVQRKPLFSSKIFCKIWILTLSFIFDKYCPIRD